MLGTALSVATLIACAAAAITGPATAHAAGLYPALVKPTLAPSLGEPADIAVALNGEMFVADGANGRIAVMLDGRIVRDWDGSEGPGPELLRPSGIAIGPDDLVYVADSAADRVIVYSREGQFVRMIGATGSGNGQLLAPSDIAVDAGGLWVADTFNDRVQRFSLSGTWLKSVGGGVSGMPLFMRPVAVDLYNGLVYVSEATGLRGQAFNATTYNVAVTPWGITESGGTSTSRYLRPAGIDVDPSGRMFFVDGGRGIVEQLTSTGAIVSPALGGSTGGLSQPSGVTSWSDHVLVADSLNDRIARYGLTSAAWESPLAPDGSPEPGQFCDPLGITPLADGGFIVTENGNDRVQRFGADGSLVSVFSTVGPGAVDAPAGVVASGGEFFIVDSANHRIQVYDEGGVHARTLGSQGTGAGQFASPAAIALAPDGTLLVADSGNNRVQRISTGGAHLQTIASGQVNAPRGVAVNASGVVYVADTGGHRIRSYSAAGEALATWGTFGSGAAQLRAPHGVAVDPVSEEVIVADTGNHRLQVFSASGTHLRQVGKRGTSAAELRSPKAVAVSASRDIYVADSGNHRVQRLGWDGQPPLTTATGIPAAWVNHPVTVTLSATDVGSGVAATYYRIGSGPDILYTAPVTIDAQGTTSFRFWSVDRVGNVETAQIRSIRIDSLPPSGTMTLAGGMSAIATTTVTIESTVVDAFTMSIDAGAGFGPRRTYAASTTAVVPGEGERTVRVRYYDALDNLLTLSGQVFVDVTPPVVTMTGISEGMVSSQTVTIELSAVDALSDVALIEVSVDGGAWEPYAAPLVFSDEQSYVVAYRATDSLGNMSTPQEVAFSIGREVAAGAMVLARGARAVSTTAIEVRSALEWATEMRFDIGGVQGGWQPYSDTATLALPGEGMHEVVGVYRATGGGSETTVAASIIVDLTAPRISPPRLTPRTMTIDGSGRPSVRLSTRWTAVDDGAVSTPVIAHRLTVNEMAIMSPRPDASPLISTGRHTLSARSRDAAGNWSIERLSTVHIGQMRAPMVQRSSSQTFQFRSSQQGLPRGGRAVFRCFRQQADGSWRLERSFAAKQSGSALVAKGTLDSGTWRIALEITSEGAYRLGMPCAAVTVR